MKQKNIIIFILLLIALLISVNFLTGNKLINNIYTSFKNKIDESSETLAISHIVYDNQDENNVKVLFKVSSNDGLEYVIRPDGTKINANGKKEINLDYSTPLDIENTFKIKEVGKAEIENKKIITKDFIDNQFILTEDDQTNNYTNEADNVYTTDEKSKIGLKSAYFSGVVNQRIKGNIPSCNLGTSDFTIETWVYPEEQTMPYAVILGNDNNADLTLFITDAAFDGNITLQAQGIRIINTNKKYTANKWTHYAVVRKDGVFTIYEDGQAIGTTSSYTTTNVNVSNFSIGGNLSTYNTAFKGYIDDLAIYNYAKYSDTFSPNTTAKIDANILYSSFDETLTYKEPMISRYKVSYAKKMTTDKTYKKIGVDYSENPWIENDDNPWIEYTDDWIEIENLSDLDTVNTLNEHSISTGTAKIHLMKKDIQGNVVHTYSPKICNFKTNSNFELFDYIRHTGTVASDYFTYDFPNNTSGIEPYSILYSLNRGVFSVGSVNLDMSLIPYNKASSVKISFWLSSAPANAAPSSTTGGSAEIYYVGEEEPIIKNTIRYYRLGCGK